MHTALITFSYLLLQFSPSVLCGILHQWVQGLDEAMPWPPLSFPISKYSKEIANCFCEMLHLDDMHKYPFRYLESQLSHRRIHWIVKETSFFFLFNFIYDAESRFPFLLVPLMPGFALLGFRALIFLSLLKTSTVITHICVSQCFPSKHSLSLS